MKNYPKLLREATTVLDEESHREVVFVMMLEAAERLEYLEHRLNAVIEILLEP